MIDLQSLDMVCRRGDISLIVLAKCELDAETVSTIRAYIGCLPWESLDRRRLDRAELTVADVEKSFAVTYDLMIHML